MSVLTCALFEAVTPNFRISNLSMNLFDEKCVKNLETYRAGRLTFKSVMFIDVEFILTHVYLHGILCMARRAPERREFST